MVLNYYQINGRAVIRFTEYTPSRRSIATTSVSRGSNRGNSNLIPSSSTTIPSLVRFNHNSTANTIHSSANDINDSRLSDFIQNTPFEGSNLNVVPLSRLQTIHRNTIGDNFPVSFSNTEINIVEMRY